CRSGGIGRRAWFRSMYPQGCGGSSPFFGTITALNVLHLLQVHAMCSESKIMRNTEVRAKQRGFAGLINRASSRLHQLPKVDPVDHTKTYDFGDMTRETVGRLVVR